VTLLIGATGSDGIALGADQKVMRGGEAYYSTKINIVENVAFATEGYTGLAEDFLLLLSQEVTRKKGFGSLYEAKTVAEDILSELGQRYEDVDANVGGTPQVAILLNDQPAFKWLPTPDIEEMGRIAKSNKANLWTCLGSALRKPA